MKIFLANGPWKSGDRLGVRAGARWATTKASGKGSKISPYVPFPFYLAYAAAVVEQSGFDTLLVDAIAETLDEQTFLETITRFEPDLVVLETSTPSIKVDIALAEKIHERLPEARLAFTGPHVTALPVETLQSAPLVDFILLGEYEYTLRDLAGALEKGQDLAGVLGIVWRERDGSIRTNLPRPLVKNIDDFPWPARHFLPMRNYRDSFAGLPMPGLTVWASRGCPFQCIFCVWPNVMYGNKAYRVRNPIDVVDEMEQNVNKYNLRSVSFDDDTFDIGKPRILQLSSEILRRGLKIPWTAMARADTADREMLEAMAKSGMYAIKYGVESGVQELVDAANKHLDLEKVKETVRITKDLGIKVHLTFTLGLPGETEDTIQRTIDWVIEQNPDSAQFSISTPYPGTPYYKMAMEQGILHFNEWSDFDGEKLAVLSTEALSAQQLTDSLRYAVRSWRLHRLRTTFWKRPGHYLREALRNPWRTIEVLRGNP
ncbi:MAG: radical SAM protein [Anaerolineales bacterium]|nr:radical SAM protein [Anaerolineales bacterium]